MGNWNEERIRALSRLYRDYGQGKIDEDIKDLLEMINSLDRYYTTSSCSGRIQIAEVKYPWRKTEYVILGKWHRPVAIDEVLKCIKRGRRNVWLNVEPPIIHVVAKDLNAARDMLVLVRQSGFKHSGIQGLREGRILIEVLSTDKMEVPLIFGGQLLFKEEQLETIVCLANVLLTHGKEKLARLREALRLKIGHTSFS